jgi:hypothetical protein
MLVPGTSVLIASTNAILDVQHETLIAPLSLNPGQRPLQRLAQRE